MSEEWHRLNRQLERERRVRRTRIRIGIIVAAILLFFDWNCFDDSPAAEL